MMWQQHLDKLTLAAVLLLAALLLALQLGDVKSWAAIDWLDILGEGIVLAVALSWLTLNLLNRPAGRVTDWLYYGSLLLSCSFALDLLDEFLHYPEHMRTMSWLESVPAPLGMLALTYGLMGWHQEQRQINRQLRGRERFLRDHRLLDPLTQLYGLDYLYAVLNRELALHQQQQLALSILMLDIDQFAVFNRQHGTAAGDNYLINLAELLSSQMRESDVLCRYAGDRFVAVLVHTEQAAAEIIALHLQQQLQRLTAAGQRLHCSVACIQATQTQATAVLKQAELALRASKLRGARPVYQPGHGNL